MLMDTLDLDSLDLVDMVVLIEHNFGFTVKAKDFAEIKTFMDFYQFINSRMDGSK
ncbi:Acyl carrier protein [bioreactor metagenome]|uniref:Acyl carrier protein n=1 Tax=bioreactor metagenome TaxID=1076179 RepID=A0A645J099_9ZZZZ